MEITCSNFSEQYERIASIIKNASFVALDLEFLGLEDEECGKRCSLFDTPQERYEKALHSVRRFPPVQLGLALFTEQDDGESYKVDVFSIYLFKKVSMGQDYSFSVSSLAFLNEHGFDFNKLTRSGVSHFNLDQLQRVLERFHQPHGIEIFGSHLPPLLHQLQRIIRTEVANLRRKSTGSEGAEQFAFPCIPIAITEELSDLQKHALLYKLQGCTPGIRMEINGGILMVYCQSPPERKREVKKKLFEMITRELMAASDVILAIIDARLPIVGHNSFRDMLYIYEYFVADLPDNLPDFKRAVNTVFPIVIDTKVLAEECKNLLSWHGVMNYRLESLNAFFERMSHDPAIPCPQYIFDSGIASKFRNPDSASMHDAGVDSVTTGQAFVRLAHLVALHERKVRSCVRFKHLIYNTRPLSNRLPVPLLGVPYINLFGAEPPSRNPDAIILEMIAQDDAAGLGALRRELRGKFGRWRCDVRKHEDNRIHVATNTDTTYWRVVKYYSMHPAYRVLGDNFTDSSRSLPSTPSSASSETDDSGPATPIRPLSPTGKAPFCVSHLVLDLAPVPAIKWWLFACSFIFVHQFIGRRNNRV